MNVSVEQLSQLVTAWCARHRVVPANGQVATATTVRTLRYYRSTGLLDAPTEGGGLGYGERHYLQACAVRVLQAQGLPLSRIQALLFGRNDDELRVLTSSAEKGESPDLPVPVASAATASENWQTYPLGPEFLLISRNPLTALTPEQIAAIQSILQPTVS
jgi:DNA-binding transcriptional MerR regulator